MWDAVNDRLDVGGHEATSRASKPSAAAQAAIVSSDSAAKQEVQRPSLTGDPPVRIACARDSNSGYARNQVHYARIGSASSGLRRDGLSREYLGVVHGSPCPLQS